MSSWDGEEEDCEFELASEWGVGARDGGILVDEKCHNVTDRSRPGRGS